MQNMQNQIQHDLKQIWGKEDVAQLRLRQKHLFEFGFIVDCIYALFMNEKQRIDFGKILKMIATKEKMVHLYPFYDILIKNKCAKKFHMPPTPNNKCWIKMSEKIANNVAQKILRY